jgi:hypothetical protein
MAIAFDAVVKSNGGGSANTYSFSHTTSGTNRILFVYAESNDDGDRITSVTYNSVGLTKIGSSVGVPPASGLSVFVSVWYLINPASGSNTVTINRSTTNANVIIGIALSYTGALQSGVPDSSNTGTGTAVTSLSLSTTTVANNSWAFAIMANNGGATWTATTGTERLAGNREVLDTNGGVSPAGSTTLAASSSSQNVAGMIVSFAPAITANTSNFLAFM